MTAPPSGSDEGALILKIRLGASSVTFDGAVAGVASVRKLGAARMPEGVGVELRDPHTLAQVLDDLPV